MMRRLELPQYHLPELLSRLSCLWEDPDWKRYSCALCGVAYDILWVITVYEPDPEEWVNPKTRRKIK